MPHRRVLTRDDINTIKQLRDNVPMAEIADRYKISYQRIYKIWKSDENAIPVERIIDREVENEMSLLLNGDMQSRVDVITDKETIRELQILVDNLSNENKSLRDKLSTIKLQKISGDDSLNDLQYQLEIAQQRRNDVITDRDKLRTELNDARNELVVIKREYNALAVKYNEVIAEISNSRQRVHENKSTRKNNNLEKYLKKRKRVTLLMRRLRNFFLMIWNLLMKSKKFLLVVKKKQDDNESKQLNEILLRDRIGQLDFERLQEQTRKKTIR